MLAFLLVIGLLGAAGIAIILTVGHMGRQNPLSAKGRHIVRPNIVFISIDTLRADHLGCYGYQRETSPAIDDLAGESVLFKNAFSQSSWTLTSHMSMMTSKYPHEHGVETASQVLAEEIPTLAEQLAKAGYHTAAFVNWIYVGKKYGFAKGFDLFRELYDPKRVGTSGRAHLQAKRTTNRVIAWLKNNAKRQFFLFVHYFDPHIGYEPPAPYNRLFDPDYDGPANGSYSWLRQYMAQVPKPKTIVERDLTYVTALYDGEIRYTDRHIGRLIAALDKTIGLDRCLIVLTSDHGEELNEHGSMEGHQWTLYDEVLHVPLIVHFPDNQKRGMVADVMTQGIDIAPTILGAAEVEVPASFRGHNLVDIIGGKEKPRTAVFSASKRRGEKLAIRTADYKLIRIVRASVRHENGTLEIPGYKLYDLNQDPGEQNNIYSEDMELTKVLKTELNKVLLKRTAPPSGKRVVHSPEELKRLRSLGYAN